jgi:hypothetical protein
MMNGVRDLEPVDVPGVLASWASRADTYVGQADGRRITDLWSFFRVVGEAFGGPRKLLDPITNADWFYDEVTTLYWFDDASGHPRHQQDVLVVRHADEIQLPDQYDFRSFFEDVAHFWGEEVVDVVAGGEKRGFVTYLVHEHDPQQDHIVIDPVAAIRRSWELVRKRGKERR